MRYTLVGILLVALNVNAFDLISYARSKLTLEQCYEIDLVLYEANEKQLRVYCDRFKREYVIKQIKGKWVAHGMQKM